MSNNKRDTVCVLKSINFGEADKILTVFGFYRGKFTIMAKSVRKLASKNRGNMQTMSISDISYYQGRGMGILKESKLLAAAGYSVESIPNIERVLFLLYKFLPDDQVEEEVFRQLLKLLKTEFVDEQQMNSFRLFFLENAGLIPNYRSCSDCERKTNEIKLEYINKNSFELICEHCYNEREQAGKFVRVNGLNLTTILDKFISRLV